MAGAYTGVTLIAAIVTACDSKSIAVLTAALEETCTHLCLAGEAFVRSIDVPHMLDELERCLNVPFAMHDLSVRILIVRAVAQVADLVPRGSYYLTQHSAMELIFAMAANTLLLQTCEPMADEIVRCLCIVASESREWFLKKGGLRTLLDLLNVLGDVHRTSILRSIVHLCGGVSPDHARVCVDAAVTLGSLAITALGDPVSSVHVAARDAEIIHQTLSCYAHIIDRLFVTDTESKELIGVIGHQMATLINGVLRKQRSFADPPLTRSIVLGLILELHMAQPVLSLRLVVEEGTLHVLSELLIQESHRATCDDAALVESLSIDAVDRAPLSHIQPLNLFDVIVAILPPTNACSDDALLFVPKHRWEWEDDFRNHNAFDDANADRIECEYQVQRRTRIFSPLVINHGHRPTTLHLLPLRQGPSVLVSRPIFRNPIPHGIVYREPTVSCTCDAFANMPAHSRTERSSRGGEALTRTEEDQQQQTQGPTNDVTEEPNEQRGCFESCCSVFCAAQPQDTSNGTEVNSPGNESRASRLQQRWVQRLATTPPSHDIREDVQRSPHLVSIAATRPTVAQSLATTLLPACVAVVSATVDLVVVRHATVAILRILHIIRLAPQPESKAAVEGMLPGLVSALSVAIRYAAVGAVEADRSAHCDVDFSQLIPESRSARFTGVMGAEPQNVQHLVAFTARGEILLTACDSLGVLMDCFGGENIVPLLDGEGLAGPLGEVCDYLDAIVGQEHLDDIQDLHTPMAHHHAQPATTADTAHSMKEATRSCLAHPSEADVAGRALQVLVPISNIVGNSDCNSSVTTTSFLESEKQLMEIAVRLSNPQASLSERGMLIGQVTRIVASLSGGFAALSSHYVLLLPTVAEILSQLEHECSCERIHTLEDVGLSLQTMVCLRRLLWRAVATHLTLDSTMPLIEKRNAGAVLLSLQTRDHARLIRRQILDRMDRHLVVKMTSVSGRPRMDAVACSYGGTCVDWNADIHGHFSPVTPLSRIADIVLLKYNAMAGVAASSAADTKTPNVSEPPSVDASELVLVLCFPSGKKCVAEGNIKFIDVLYAFHTIATSFRNFVEWPLNRKCEVPKPFALWHTVVSLDFILVRRKAPLLLRGIRVVGEGTESTMERNANGFCSPLVESTAPLCCPLRHTGVPACSPLHAFVDAAKAEPLCNPIAAIRAVRFAEALIKRSVPSASDAELTRLRLSSVVVNALRTLAPCFQLHFFGQLQLNSSSVPLFAPPSNLTSARSSLAESPLIRPPTTAFPRPPSDGLPLDAMPASSASLRRPPSLQDGVFSVGNRPPHASSPLNRASSNSALVGSNASLLLQKHFAFAALALTPSLIPLELRHSLLRRVCMPRFMSALSVPRPPVNPPPGGAVRALAATSQSGGTRKAKITVLRDQFFQDATAQLHEFALEGALFDVEFIGEPGRGPGPTAEFFSLLASHLRNVEPSPWVEAQRLNRGTLYPKLMDASSSASYGGVFQTLGELFGRLLVENRHANLPLHPLLWSAITGEDLLVHSRDNIKLLDPELAASLQSVLDADEEQLAAMDLVFVLPGDDTVELVPNGCDIRVNISNCHCFVAAVERVWLAQAIELFAVPFHRGLKTVLSPLSLSMFTGEELRTTICGPRGKLWPSAESFLQGIHCAHGYKNDADPVHWLASIVSEFDEASQRNFLQFVAGTDCLPDDGLSPPMTIVRRDVEENIAAGRYTPPPGFSDSTPEHLSPHSAVFQDLVDASLPTVNTCFHYIKLPPYSSRAVLERRLLYALAEGQGSFQLS